MSMTVLKPPSAVAKAPAAPTHLEVRLRGPLAPRVEAPLLDIRQPPGAVIMAPAAPAHPEVRLRGPLAPHVKALLRDIRRAAGGLTPQHREEVAQIMDEWKAIFFATYRIDSPLQTDREDAAHALLFLRLNTIEYVMVNYAAGDTEKLKWLDIYNALEKIAGLALPEHVDVKAFIEADTQKQLEMQFRMRIAQVIKEVLPMIAKDFARLESGLYDNVDRATAAMQREFEDVRARMAELMRDRSAGIEELHGELRRLTENIENMYQRLEAQLKETQDRGRRIEMKERALAQLLDACEGVLNGVNL